MSALGAAALALLLAAPLMHWRRSREIAALYLAAAIAWLAARRAAGGAAYEYWLLLLPAAPALRWPEERNAAGWALAWAAVLSVAAGALYSLEIRARDLAALLFPSVAAGIYAWGARWPRGSPRVAAAHHVGALGIVACTALFCRPQAWGFAGHVDQGWPPPAVDLAGSLGVIALFGWFALRAAAQALRDRAWPRALGAGLPLFALLGIGAIHATHSRALAATLLLGYGLALAASLARSGHPRLAAGLAVLFAAMRLIG